MRNPTLSVVSPDWLASHRESITIVDVRDRHDYEQLGHIPGAVHVPYDGIRNPAGGTMGHLPQPETFGTLFAEAGIEPDDHIVAYDDERGVYAARVLLTAEALGHEGNISLLDGGFSAWRKCFETTTATVEPAPRAYEASEPGHPVVGREAVETALNRDDSVLVDTREPAEYDAAHIPGAVQLGWEDLLDDGFVRPATEIRALLSQRGIERDSRIVLYCNTARRLSHTYVVLSDIGYDNVVAYEGSLTDWIRQTSSDWSPADLQSQVEQYAEEGFDRMVAELGEGVLDRLKLVGLYHQKQRGYFMVRTKVPGGNLTAEQARVIGEVADEFARAPEEHGGENQNTEWGDGYLDLTDRQDIQMHWIRIRDMPEIWDRYAAVGLTTMQACGNSIRNVVSCPVTGLDPAESMDAQSVATEITDRFLADDEYANLPRKFKISVTGCHENCARAEINDLGLVPARKGERIGFNALVGGGLSDSPRMARDLDVFIEPNEVVELVEAMADYFIEFGSYLDTAVNRLRFIVAELGLERVREEIEARATFEFESAGEGLTDRYRGDHVGIHDQSDGDKYVGLNVPVGRMGGDEFARLADLASTYGTGEVRLTLQQNAIVPGIDPDDVTAFLAESLIQRYTPNPGPFSRGMLACTGKEYCTYGIVNTKNRAVRWARELDAWYETEYDGRADPEAIRIHFSGCSASCAQPQIGDIGLRGEDLRTIEGSQPAVDVGLGGDLGSGQFVDWVVGSFPTKAIPAAIERLIDQWAAETDGAESFSAWLDRTSRRRLYELVTVAPEESPQPTHGDD